MHSSEHFYDQIPIDFLRHARSEKQLDFLVDLVGSKFSPHEHVLDIGCGLGEVIAALPHFDITGIERSKRLIANCVCAPERIIHGNILDNTLPSGTYDALYMVWAVLNEFYCDKNVVNVLWEAKRILRPGGHGLIDIPFIDEQYLRHFDVSIKNGLVTLTVCGLPIDQKVITPDDLRNYYCAAGLEIYSIDIVHETPWPYPRVISTFQR